MNRERRRGILSHYKRLVPIVRALDVDKFSDMMMKQEGMRPSSDRVAIAAMKASIININKWCKSTAHGNCDPIFSDDEVESAKVWLESEGFHSMIEGV